MHRDTGRIVQASAKGETLVRRAAALGVAQQVILLAALGQEDIAIGRHRREAGETQSVA
jgi:hypothetical protein